MLPDIATPSSASQKNSYAPNDSETSASSGVNAARHSTPNSVPLKAPDVAMPMARPASPRSASAWPSAHEAALVARAGSRARRGRGAVGAGGRVGRGAGNVEQDRGARAAIEGSDIGADQDQD